MKSTGAVLSVQVETQGACGGQRLRGKVFLDVSKDMIPATSLNIQFYGVETTHVYNAFSGEDEPNYWEECHEFFGIEIALQNFHNECVTKGRYVFPFDFQLPVGLPGKQGVRTGTNDSFFVVEYFLQAHLHRNGNLVANAKNRTEVFLSDTPFVAYAKFPAFVEPITELIGSCCCGIVGSVTIAAHIDSTHVCIGEKLKIEYGVQNDSSKGLDAVEIRIREIRSFRAQGQNKEVIMVKPDMLPHLCLNFAHHPFSRSCSVRGLKPPKLRGRNRRGRRRHKVPQRTSCCRAISPWMPSYRCAKQQQ